MQCLKILTNSNRFYKAGLLLFSISLFLFDSSDSQAVSLIQEESCKDITYYVATNGNDRWSGTISSPNTMGTDGPFATLKQARNSLRKIRKKGCNANFTVLVRGGIYHLNETFVLEPEDSGNKPCPLVFKAYNNEKPILCGTKTIINFEPFKGNIVRADLSDITNKLPAIRQLFAEGKRQVLSRHPNFIKSQPLTGGFLFVTTPRIQGSRSEFSFQSGSIPILPQNKGAEVVIFPGNNWTNNILPFAKINNASNFITLSKNTTHDIKPFNRFYIQNLFDVLDSPGEWYFDRHTSVLYYWPERPQHLDSASIPIIDTIFKVKPKRYKGKSYGTPSHIQFEGFTINGCRGSAITIHESNYISISGCTIMNAGMTGIEIKGGTGNLVFGNDISEVGREGIRIYGKRPNNEASNNRAENNYIHHIGVIHKNSSGIYCQGTGNNVSRNLIQDTPRMGILFNGNDHIIEYNHIHHVNQETEDSGIVYTSQIDWTKRGNVIRFNYLHNSGGYGRNKQTGEWQRPIHTYGIYLDDWTSGTHVYGNIVVNTSNGGVFIHGGRDNVIENNIIIEGGKLGQMVYSAWPPGTSTAKKWLPVMFSKIGELQKTQKTKYSLISSIKDVQTGAKMSGNQFIYNIIYYKRKDSPLFGIFNDFDFETTLSDYNVIFNNDLTLKIPFLKGEPEQQWTMWIQKGFDRNSIVADPEFLNIEQGDYRLAQTSPALKLGFKPISFDKVGLYKHPLRASWPIGEALTGNSVDVK